uniref:Uncharacterized protein n=1 Tax=Anguilla anguilla TaxID=7936 RepID=A0A0E9RJJ8_ANGAN
MPVSTGPDCWSHLCTSTLPFTR